MVVKRLKEAPSACERSSRPGDSAPSEADGDSQDGVSARARLSPPGLLVSEPSRGKCPRRRGCKNPSANRQCVATATMTPSLYEMLQLLLGHGTLRDLRNGQYVRAGRRRGQCPGNPFFEQVTQSDDAIPFMLPRGRADNAE